MRAKLLKVKGKQALIEFDSDLELGNLIPDAEGFIYLDAFFDDDRFISNDQRKHFYALVVDVHEYTGYPKEAVEDYLKYNFMQEMDLDVLPSLARQSMSRAQASELLEHVIEWCIYNDVPFRKQQFYLTTDTSKMIFALTMKRLCVVCGRPNSDIHHVDAIGAGADRKTHDHSKHEFLSLCREHHGESHNIGQQSFMSKYYLKPVKLNVIQLKQLGVM